MGKHLVGSFGDVGVSPTIIVPAGGLLDLSLYGTYVATVQLQRQSAASGGWLTLREWSTEDATVDHLHTASMDGQEVLRLRAIAYTSGAVTYTAKSVDPSNLSSLAGAGAPNGSHVYASEESDGYVHKTTLNFSGQRLTVTDALAYLGTKIYDFPRGRILLLGTLGSLVFQVTSARAGTINLNAAMDWALGSVAASNITLASTMLDMLPKVDKTLDAADDGFHTASTGALVASAQFDGTSTPVDMFLNLSFPTNTEIDADGTMTVTGQIVFHWINLGEF